MTVYLKKFKMLIEKKDFTSLKYIEQVEEIVNSKNPK